MRSSARPPALLAALLAAALTALGAVPAGAGGYLETLDITGREPVPGSVTEVEGRIIPVRWDDRCIPPPFHLNDTLDPLPNPLGPPRVTLDEADRELGRSLAAWNRVPGSYFDFRRAGRVSNPGPRSFDFVNEVTFRAPSFFSGLARTTMMTLIEDTYLAAGDDIDEDGDPDVATGLRHCRDADGDGDFELPAGLYRAGTLLDVDVEVNTEDYRFTTRREEADTETSSVDLRAVLTHEAGHAHGLAHSLTNQIGRRDGTGATMHALFDTGDPADELAFRSLAAEDLASSAYHYPARSFGDFYAVFAGEAVAGDQDRPLAGGAVYALEADTGKRLGSAVTGTARNAVDPDTGRRRRVSPDYDIVDGRYHLPVPRGRSYRVGIEAPDGFPLSAAAVNWTTLEGAVFGQLDFPEELWTGFGDHRHRYDRYDLSYRTEGDGGDESAREPSLVRSREVAGNRRGVDIVTEDAVRLAPYGRRTNYVSIGAAPGSWYAVRFPAEEFRAAAGTGRYAVLAGRFHTFPVDASVVPRFDRAVLTVGRLRADGSARLDLAEPLLERRPFTGQDDDFAALAPSSGLRLAYRVRRALAADPSLDLFLALQVPTETPFPGVSELPPLIGTSRVGVRGRSYRSEDGRRFEPVTQEDYRFDLLIQPEPRLYSR